MGVLRRSHGALAGTLGPGTRGTDRNGETEAAQAPASLDIEPAEERDRSRHPHNGSRRCLVAESGDSP